MGLRCVVRPCSLGEPTGPSDPALPPPQRPRSPFPLSLRLPALFLVLSVHVFLQCTSPSASSLFPFVSAQCSGDRVAVDFPFVFGVTGGSCPTGAATVPVSSTCQMACGAGFTTGAGGLITCTAGNWTGQSLMCDPVECIVPPLPFGCTVGTCVPGGMLSGGASCTWSAAVGMALQTGSLTITCGHFGITQGPTMTVTPCVPAVLPQGTAFGRCDSIYCYLRPLPNWTLRFGSLQLSCSAGVPVQLPVMKPAEFFRIDPLFAPMLGDRPLIGSAVDAAEQYLYFSDPSNSHVWRLTLDTGAMQQVDLGGTALDAPFFLLLDETLNALYICDPGLRNVFRVRLSDGVVSSALGVSGVLLVPRQMALDSARVHLYLVDGGTRQLYRLSLQSSSPASLVPILPVSPFSAPYGLVLSASDDAAYVSDSALSRLFRVNLTTGTTSLIDSGAVLTNPAGIAWDRSGTGLLIGMQATILSMPLTSGVLPTTISLSPFIINPIGGSIALGANGINAYAVTGGGVILRVQMAPGCSGAVLPEYFPMGNGVSFGSCPTDSTLHSWGYSCQLGCSVGFTPVSGGAMVCSQAAFGWTGGTQVCDPVSCELPPLPDGVDASSCAVPSLLFGEACSYALLPGRALSFGSLRVSCDHFGLTPGPVVVDSTCNAAPLPAGTTYGRCDATYCYLQPLPGWTLKAGSLQVTCTAGSFSSSTLPIMEQAAYGRTEPLFSPLFRSANSTGWTDPRFIALDSTSTYAYVTDGATKHVWRLTLSTGAIRQMDTSGIVLQEPLGLCLDETSAGSICVHPTSGLLYFSDTYQNAIYSLNPASSVVTRIGSINIPMGVQLDVTQTVLWISDYNGQLWSMPLATAVPTLVPFSMHSVGSGPVTTGQGGAVLDSANRYAYWATSGNMWRINLQDEGGVAFADQDRHAFTLYRVPIRLDQTSDAPSAAFFIVPDITLPFPSSLLLTRIVRATAGEVTASLDGGLPLMLPLNVGVSLSLPSGSPNSSIVINGTFTGAFGVTFANPCGFAPLAVGGPGSMCAPASACLPRDSDGFVCSPFILTHSLRVVDPAAGNSDAAMCTAGCVTADVPRALVLPRNWAGLVVRFDIASSSLGANFSFSHPAPFTSLEVSLVSDFAAPIPCAGAAVVRVSSANVTVQCALPSTLIGAAFRIQLRTQAGFPPQWTTHVGSDSLSSSAPSIIPLSFARVSPFPHRVNESSFGDLIALGQGETLSLTVSFALPASLQPLQLYFGSRSVIQSALTSAAVNRSGVSYVLPDAQLIPLSHLSILAQLPGLFPCAISQPTLYQPNLLVCVMPAFGVAGTLLHTLLVIGGQVAVSADSYSYPTTPMIQRVSSSQCVDSGNGTVGCPTRGGVTLTVTGTLFSLSDSQVLVNGLACPVTNMGVDGSSIECTLPPGAGTNVAVVVQAFGVFSAAFTLLSYARPEIQRISSSACESDNSGVLLTDCDRLGNATLLLQGQNFGPVGSQVFVGLHICQSDGVQHADPHSITSCRLPSGKTLDQPVLLLQKNGQLSVSAVSLSYTRCAAGTHESDPLDPLALACLRCGPGSFSADGASTCTVCPPGFITSESEFGAVSCSPCPQRTRRLQPGGTECAACLAGEYQPSIGSAECFPCPSGLYLNSASLNASVANCVACPAGAVCGGGALLSANGFFISRSADGSIHSFLCPTGYCTACDSSSVASASVNLSSPLLTSVATCCAAHRDPSSPLCGSCLSGFVEWNGVCQPCDQPNGGLIFLIFLLSLLVVVWLLRSSGTAPTGVVAVFLYFTQTAVLQLGSTAALLSWIGFFNFDLAFFVPHSADANCLAPIDAYGQTVLSLCIPLIFLAELCIIAIVHRIAFNTATKSDGRGTSGKDGGLAGSSTHPSDAESSSVPWRVSVTGRARVELVGVYSRWSRSFDFWSYINGAMAILLFTYTQVVSTCVKFLWCVDVDDRSVVFSTPSMNCRSQQYARVLGLVIAVIVVYVVGFPLAIVVTGLQRARKRQAEARRLHNAQLASATVERPAVVVPANWSASVSAGQWHLAPLFGMYLDGVWCWSAVVLVRRVLFVVADVTLADRLAYRSMVFAMLNTSSVLSLMIIRPLQLAQLNVVEVGSHVLLLFVALLMATDAPPYSSGLQICFFLLIVPPLVLYALFALRARRLAAAAARTLGVSPIQSLDSDSCVAVGADEFDPPLQRNPSLALASSPFAFSASSAASSDSAASLSVQPEHIELREMHSDANGMANSAETQADGVDASTQHQAIV